MKPKEFQYSSNARRKPINLTVNEDLLAAARKCKLNLSRLLEECLVTELRSRWQGHWLKKNRAAIAEYNKRIGKRGVFSDGIRRF